VYEWTKEVGFCGILIPKIINIPARAIRNRFMVEPPVIYSNHITLSKTLVKRSLKLVDSFVNPGIRF
jgi:hypothetical protein